MSSTREKFAECHKNYVTILFRELALPAIVDHLKKREDDTEVTVEELEGVLELSIDGLEPVVIHPVIKSGSRRKKITSAQPEQQQEQEEGKCHYKFKRGKNKGLFCQNATVGDTQYCNIRGHRHPTTKTKSVTKTGNSTTKKTTSSQDTGLINKKEKSKENEALMVSPYLDIPDYFHHTDTGFIVYDKKDVVSAVAKEEENGDFRVLTDEEKLEAKKLTLVTLDGEEAEKELSHLKEAVDKIKGEGSSNCTTSDQKLPAEEPMISQTAPPPVLPEIPTVPSIPG